jgi:hypothetical protein
MKVYIMFDEFRSFHGGENLNCGRPGYNAVYVVSELVYDP